MAFFTFTTISGSAATNNLVLAATNTGALGAVSVKLDNGIVTYYNADGNWTSTGYGLDAFAPSGIAATGTGPGVPAAALVYNALTVGTDLTTFQTPGFVGKAAEPAGGFVVVDADGATSAQIDAFIANHVGAAPGSLINASVNASQFYALNDAVAASYFAAGGVVELDATGATTTQVNAIVTEMGLVGTVFDTASVDNLTIGAADYSTLVTAGDEVYFAAAGATVNALGAGAVATTAVLADVAASLDKVNTVQNLSIANTDLAAVLAISSVVANQGVIATNAGGAAGFGANDWANVIANRTLFAPNSITNADNVSVTQFATIPNKFVAAQVNGATLMSLATASTAQEDLLVTNVSKLATGGAANGLSAANLSPSQFSVLASKIANAQATVNASGATSAEVTAILNNLGKFAATSATTGLSYLTLTPEQVNSLTAAQGASLAAAVPATGAGVTQVTSATQFSMDASSTTAALNVTGSSYADSMQLGGAATVQGGMGADVIVGSATASSLSGGNAADTIIGGAGADTITGGNSIAANVLTGNGSADRFITNGGLNTITDLGGAAGADADIVIVSSGVTTNAEDVIDWAATATSTNAGAFTITTDGTGTALNANTVDAHLMGGAVGVTLQGGAGVDDLTGTANVDAIRGGNGADSIDGYLGNDVLTGGMGADNFYVNASQTVSVTDLGKGGADALIVAAGATVNAAVTTNWVAAATTAVTAGGVATLTLNNGINADLTLAGGNFTVTASGNTVASAITGSAGNDTIVGSNVADTIVGLAGTNKVTGGTGGDTITLAGTDTIVYSAVAQTYEGVVVNNTTVLTGVDKVTGMAAADKVDLTALLATYNATVNKGVALLDGLTGTAALVRGDYNTGANGKFATSLAGADLLLQWDTNGASAGGVESVVLIGSGAGVASATAVNGLLTLA
jgi:RTX calcium-binding nonapeptide repeat (4 copies)